MKGRKKLKLLLDGTRGEQNDVSCVCAGWLVVKEWYGGKRRKLSEEISRLTYSSFFSREEVGKK